MTLREMLGLVQGPVKLLVHVTNGASEIAFARSTSGPQRMLSELGVLTPTILDASVSSVDSENSPLKMGAGSFFNDGPAVTVIHVTRRTIL